MGKRKRMCGSRHHPKLGKKDHHYHHQDKKLDKDIESTFPASDAITKY